MIAVSGVSYIGRPKPNTAMYVTAKVGYLCENLKDVSGCLVFAENGIAVPDGVLESNEFCFSDNPLLAYVEFSRTFEADRDRIERAVPYHQTETGAIVSDSAIIGEGSYLEPGVLVGPGVIIGREVTVLSGAIIRHATIGDRVVVNERAVIGTKGFTMARDSIGDLVRIPTLGGVVIGDDVEIGVNDNVSCGSGGDTVICDHAKLDALVYVGHDVTIGRNVEIPAGVAIGGFCEIGDDTFIGLGAVLRNRVEIGVGATVGMGAVVTKSVDAGVTSVGNPARPFEQRK